MKADIYSEVTQTIIAQLEKGTAPWRKPWDGQANGMPLRATGQPYRGVNVFLLQIATMSRGYASPYWLTYKKAAEVGGNVRKGEKSTQVTFWHWFKSVNEAGEVKRVPFLRAYRVFNADQCENLPPRYVERPPIRSEFERHALADAVILGTGARINHVSGDRAFYAPGLDAITLPEATQFPRREDYYATALHELTHWTGHESRLARDFSGRFGSNAYAFEELIAEMGSAFLCAHIGISAEPRADHAAYLAHWLDVLRADKKAIFTAASKAQAASDLVLGVKHANEETEQTEQAEAA